MILYSLIKSINIQKLYYSSPITT